MSPPPRSWKRGAGHASTASTTRPTRSGSTALRQALVDLGVPGLALAKGQALRPELFNRILERAAGRPEAALINDLVLRAQAQAAYSPANIGHFGLALRRYAHFTSPIRRYADLVVHRALLGETLPGGEELAAIAEHVSATERRATAAERAALDRYRVRLLAGMIGEVSSPPGSAGWPASVCSCGSPTAAPTGWCRCRACRSAPIASTPSGSG